MKHVTLDDLLRLKRFATRLYTEARSSRHTFVKDTLLEFDAGAILEELAALIDKEQRA